ncbi:hypothetical protein KAW38_00185 [Candidatus Micrarchaeota archaeon]|nr:hypothetical protein [Candidatus Micrarchaeota archaeon]
MERVILFPCATIKSIELRARAAVDMKKIDKWIEKYAEEILKNELFLSFLYKDKAYTLFFKPMKITLKDVGKEEGERLINEIYDIFVKGRILYEN